MAVFDRIQKIVSGIIDARQSFCIAFGVGCPKNDYFVEIVVTLEFAMAGSALIRVCRDGLPDVFTDLVYMNHACL